MPGQTADGWLGDVLKDLVVTLTASLAESSASLALTSFAVT